ncbi:hypothetical protein [Allocoleopsis sp.]|uniref:hypothetical protein n=1 Tax=Allocoleopsis sp. TaxID=3088169 RepID=UPI002FD4CDD9
MGHLQEIGKASIVTLGVLAYAALPGGAIPFGSNKVYRVGQDVIISAPAGTKVDVGLGSRVRNKAQVAGSCGEVKITLPKNLPATVQVGTKTLTIANLPTQSLPSCKNGQFAEARTADFKTPEGKVVAVGFTPSQSVAVGIPTPTTRKVSINACGFGTIKGASGSITVNGQDYNVAQLPDAGAAPACRKGTAYTPSSWSR